MPASNCGDYRAAVRQPVARAQGRRLAARRALRFRRCPRRDAGPHAPVALDHRRQSRPERRLALSRPGDDRALPDDDLRRRAALSDGRGARRERDRRAQASLSSIPITQRSAEIARLKARFRAGRAVRRAFDPLAHSAPVRRRAAGRSISGRTRRELQPGTAGGARRGARRERAELCRRRPLQGRLDHPRLWEARARGSRRSSSNSPAAPTCSSPSAPRPPTGRSRSTTDARDAAPARRCGDVLETILRESVTSRSSP